MPPRREVPLPPVAATVAPAPRPALPAAAARDEALYRVDGRAVTKADVGDFVLRYFPDRAQEALDQLLDEALFGADASREGVTVPEALVRERTDAYVEERRRETRLQYGSGADFDTLVRERYGRTLPEFRADAERLVRTLLLRDRVVRLAELREDGVEVRVLVLPTDEAARDAATSLRDGADMTLLAERNGLRAPAAPPPFARGDVPDAALEARLFAAAPGDVLDPVAFDAPPARKDGEPRRWWQVFRVVRRWTARAEPWASIGPEVEASLRDAPVTAEEYLRWRRRALTRHEVEVRDAAKGFVRWPRRE